MAGVPFGRLLDEPPAYLRPLPMMVARAGRTADLPIGGGLGIQPAAVGGDHQRIRIIPIKPGGGHIADDVQNHPEPQPAAQLHQPIDIRKVVCIPFGHIPSPLYPKLHRVEAL